MQLMLTSHFQLERTLLLPLVQELQPQLLQIHCGLLRPDYKYVLVLSAALVFCTLLAKKLKFYFVDNIFYVHHLQILVKLLEVVSDYDFFYVLYFSGIRPKG